MGTYAAVFPRRRVTLLLFFVLPVTLSARALIFGFGVVTLVALIVGAGEGQIAHAAHLAGGVAGYLYGRAVLGGNGWAAGTRQGWRRTTAAWHAKRRGWRVVDAEARGSSPTEPRRNVDDLLDKIKRGGLESLTREERDALERASRGDVE